MTVDLLSAAILHSISLTARWAPLLLSTASIGFIQPLQSFTSNGCLSFLVSI